MKAKRKIISGALAILVLFHATSITRNLLHGAERKRTVDALRGRPYDRVNSAIQAFAAALKAQGRAVPETASLRELVASGFLRPEEAAPFGAQDATFIVGVHEADPQQMVARVPLDGGREVVMLADGSILQVAR